MNHRSTSEVDGLDGGVAVPDTVHEAGHAPDHVSHRDVNYEHPDKDERHDCGEFHALSGGAYYKGGGDDREHQLIHRENVLGDPVAVIGVRSTGYSLEEEEFGSAYERRVEAFSENQTVANGPPEHCDHSGASKALSQHAEDVLFPHQAAIEQGEAWKGHEKNQCGASHEPAVVTWARGAVDIRIPSIFACCANADITEVTL